MTPIKLPSDRLAASIGSWPAGQKLSKPERLKAAKLALRLVSEERGEVVGNVKDMELAFAWAEIHARTLVERITNQNAGLGLLTALQKSLADRRKRWNGRTRRYVEIEDCRSLVDNIACAEKLRKVPLSGSQSTLVSDSAFQAAVLELVQNAKERLWLSSFYFRDAPDAPSFIRQLVSELINLPDHVDVRVLLEGRDTGRAPAALVNKDVVERLGGSRVQVRLRRHEPGRMHAKMVLRDDRRGLLGSHNLTAGSLYRYNDLSFIFESSGIASSLAGYFRQQWEGAERVPLR